MKKCDKDILGKWAEYKKIVVSGDDIFLRYMEPGHGRIHLHGYCFFVMKNDGDEQKLIKLIRHYGFNYGVFELETPGGKRKEIYVCNEHRYRIYEELFLKLFHEFALEGKMLVMQVCYEEGCPYNVNFRGRVYDADDHVIKELNNMDKESIELFYREGIGTDVHIRDRAVEYRNMYHTIDGVFGLQEAEITVRKALI